MINLMMTSDRDGQTESGAIVPAGTVVEYMGHTFGGYVRVRLPDGTVTEMDPRCFPQLR